MYQYEILKHKQRLASLDLDRELDSRDKREQERLTELVTKLQQELITQEQVVNNTMERFKLEKESWFANCKNRYDLINVMLQHCIRPRCLFSANDATFCARFIFALHNVGTVNFSSLRLLDTVLLQKYFMTLGDDRY